MKSLKWAENLTTYLCSQKHKENLASLENNEEELATLGTIHILCRHIFGPFLTHPSTTDKRTDVWSRTSYIYTQIFSPRKNWFSPHKKYSLWKAPYMIFIGKPEISENENSK